MNNGTYVGCVKLIGMMYANLSITSTGRAYRFESNGKFPHERVFKYPHQ